ncbi:penicillin-binding transpeptidase domain-containing protein [Gandjariella thermophila]|nr:penicillin-binding transpeptidase domain-containing protein [Gandjariella thermophila]
MARGHLARRHLGTVAALVVAVPLAGCGLFQSKVAGVAKPGPAGAARTFLTALAAGDTAGAAQATDDPANAKGLLDRTRDALKPVAVTATLGNVNDPDPGGSANATYQASWDLGKGRTWSYQGGFDLRRNAEGWKVHWAPSVLHPKLGAQQSLALRVQPPAPAPVLDANGAPLPPSDTVVASAVGKAVDDQMAAKAGWRVVTVNAAGGEVDQLAGKPPAPVQPATTTIAPNVQAAAEAAVGPVPQPAVLVAMRPSTGELLAVAQNPPADAQGPIAFSGRFPPGSTFKIVTAVAALESGKATADTPEPCPGTTQVNGHEIPNEDKFDKGVIPLHAAFAFSCNTTFGPLAAQLPADALPNTAKQLGIGVDFDMPGATTLTGGVPPTNDSTERAMDGFGQGKDIVSPFGMALAAATVANGTMPMPSLLRGQPAKADANPPPVPQPVVDAVRQMMREVVAYGTATHVKDIPGVAGKTGTAQFGDGVHSHGWFVGFRGDLAFAVLLLGADSSTPAVDVTGAFLRALH